MNRVPFNSLSRDHHLSSTSRCFGLNSGIFQLPLSGSLTFATFATIPIFLPLPFNSLSRDHGRAGNAGFLPDSDLSTPSLGITTYYSDNSKEITRYSLSTPSLGITDPETWEEFLESVKSAFNSLSRDHRNEIVRMALRDLFRNFQLPLSGSQNGGAERATSSGAEGDLSTPSLGITSEK